MDDKHPMCLEPGDTPEKILRDLNRLIDCMLLVITPEVKISRPQIVEDLEAIREYARKNHRDKVSHIMSLVDKMFPYFLILEENI
jgi:hypothetical protein